MIFMNYWSISRDPTLFDDPDTFMPERYLEHPQGFGKVIRARAAQSGLEYDGLLKLWPGVAFGAGKVGLLSPNYCLRVLTLSQMQRKCPGRYLAQNVLHLAALRLLWAFSFDKPKDSSGRDVDVDIWNDKPVRAFQYLLVQAHLTDMLHLRAFWELPSHLTATYIFDLLNMQHLSTKATATARPFFSVLSRN